MNLQTRQLMAEVKCHHAFAIILLIDKNKLINREISPSYFNILHCIYARPTCLLKNDKKALVQRTKKLLAALWKITSFSVSQLTFRFFIPHLCYKVFQSHYVLAMFLLIRNKNNFEASRTFKKCECVRH